MVTLIPFDKIFEISAGVASLLAGQSNCCSKKLNSKKTIKIECLYTEVKRFHFITFLVSQCKLVYYELFF